MTLEIKDNQQRGMNSQQDILAFNSPNIYVVDDISLIHQIKIKKFSVFGAFTELLLLRIKLLLSPNHVKRCEIAFGRYE